MAAGTAGTAAGEDRPHGRPGRAVARVELAAAAVADLDGLIRTHSLPADTKRRVKRSLSPLKRFPRLGPELHGRWQGFRFVLGPWRWLIIVYVFMEEHDRVVVVTLQDGRSSVAATHASGKVRPRRGRGVLPPALDVRSRMTSEEAIDLLRGGR